MPKESEVNALATIPCTEKSNEMVQGFGWLQVAKCAQGDILDFIDEAHAGSRHDGIMKELQAKPLQTDCSRSKEYQDQLPDRLCSDPWRSVGPEIVLCREILLHNE